MGRIAKAYRVKFRALLSEVKARRLDESVAWLSRQAQQLRLTEGLTMEVALTRIYERTRRRVNRWQERHGQLSGPNPGERPRSAPDRFLCDAGLGGLARWLRAAGYEARWEPHIDDDELLQEARRLGATLLTTDSLLMERRALRDGIIPALWLPPALGGAEQLAQVMRELRLSRRPPRCMKCGGELRPVDKESMRERIPPRTYRWLDEFFMCQNCQQLFWHGTHWQRIQERLPTALAAPAP